MTIEIPTSLTKNDKLIVLTYMLEKACADMESELVCGLRGHIEYINDEFDSEVQKSLYEYFIKVKTEIDASLVAISKDDVDLFADVERISKIFLYLDIEYKSLLEL